MMIIIVDDMVLWDSGRNSQGGGFPGITDGGGTITRGYSKGGPGGGGSSDSDGGLFSMIFGSNTNAAAAALRPGKVWSILFTIILNWYFSHHRRWYWLKGFHYLFNSTNEENMKRNKKTNIYTTPICKNCKYINILELCGLVGGIFFTLYFNSSFVTTDSRIGSFFLLKLIIIEGKWGLSSDTTWVWYQVMYSNFKTSGYMWIKSKLWCVGIITSTKHS